MKRGVLCAVILFVALWAGVGAAGPASEASPTPVLKVDVDHDPPVDPAARRVWLETMIVNLEAERDHLLAAPAGETPAEAQGRQVKLESRQRRINKLTRELSALP